MAEAYPDLKANQNFLNLQEELTVDRGPHRLRAAVLQRQRAELQHTRSRSSRTVILAGMFNFEKREFFDAEPEDTEPGRSSSSPDRPARRAADRVHGTRRHHRVRADRAQQAPHVPDAVRASSCSSRSSAVAHRLLLRRRLRRRRRSRSSSRSRWRGVSYFNSDKVALAAEPGASRPTSRVPPLPQPRRGPVHRRRAARSRGSTSSTTPRRTRSPPAATRSTPRSRSPPACSRR